MDERSQAMQQWLQDHCGFPEYRLIAMAGDASFRRYFRLYHGDHSYVVMDAPPDREQSEPFIRIAQSLREQGLKAPEIFYADARQGFLVLSDFGDQRMLNMLNMNNAEFLYTQAIDALVQIQKISVTDHRIPFFTKERMFDELIQFEEWFLYRYLAMTLTLEMKHELHQVFHFLCETASSQPHVFMHRDYHSANLMVLPENQIGILDFQDAFIGPIAYDLVSLLRDCYIDWPDFLVTKLALAYLNKLDNPAIDQQQFLRWFDLMGLQRHLKALLTFSRKFIRDFNNQYLRYIPRTLNYIQVMSSRYPECQFLHRLCQQQILPLHQGKAFVCAP